MTTLNICLSVIVNKLIKFIVMRKILLLFVVALLYVSSAKADIYTFFNSSDDFFNKYVKDGRVSYVSVKRNFGEIESLYKEVGNMNLTGLDDNTRKAFYLNAYNIIVIYQVSKYYPLKSALDQSGFFDKVRHKVAGENITLNELEIKKIVLKFKDPRIHFALACAAVSCPELASFAYQPSKIDEQLNARTVKAINDPAFIRIDQAQKQVNISEIFKWYNKDFTSTGKTLLQFINQYRNEPIPVNYTQGFYQYDWRLNEQL